MSRIRKETRTSIATKLAMALVGIGVLVSVGLFMRQLRVQSAQAIEPATRGDYSGEVGQSVQTTDTGIQSGTSDAVGQITVTGSNFRIEGDFLVADICYDLPSQEDWLLSRKTSLVLKDQTIIVFEWGLIDWKYSENGEKVQRCDDVNFWVQGVGSISEFQIVIPRLETSWPSQLDCEDAQEELDLINSGIQIECVQTEYSYGPEVVSKPESLSDDAVQILVEEAFIDLVEGPWIITGSLP